MQLTIRPHELCAPGVPEVPVPAGLTIRQILEHLAGTTEIVPCRVRVNGQDVPYEWWGHLRPKESSRVEITPLTLHGGGAKRTLAAIAMIVVSVYAPGWGTSLSGKFFAGSTLAAKAIGAGIMVGASLVAGALVGAPKASSGQSQRWNSLTGTSNIWDPFGVVNHVVGEAEFFPKMACMPYTEVVGEKQYQYVMLDLGYPADGPMLIDRVKYAGTAIENYEEVRLEYGTDPAMFKNDIYEESVDVVIDHEETDEIIRTTSPTAERVSFDLVAANQGLFGVGTSGKDFAMTIYLRLRYRKTGETEWSPLPAGARLSMLSPSAIGPAGTTHVIQGLRKNPFGASVSFDLPEPGQYDISVTRMGDSRSSNTKNQYYDDLQWTVLRSIRNAPASTTGTMKLAIGIRATDQMTGVMDRVSLRVRQQYKTYDPTTGQWTEPMPTTNTAWVVWHEMTASKAMRIHKPVSMMHLDEWVEYAQWCEDYGFHTRLVQDVATRAFDYINNILAGSLASMGARDGKHAPVWDKGDPTYQSTVTPMDRSGLTGGAVFHDVAHAYRVKFVNIETVDWQQDEIIVLQDGYSYQGLDARGNPSTLPPAQKFAEMTIEMAMSPQQAWMTCRYNMAQLLFRNIRWSWKSELSKHTICRGDVVRMLAPRFSWGEGGWGRVVSVEGNTVRLHQPVDCEQGFQWAAQLRGHNNQLMEVDVGEIYGLTETIELAQVPSWLTRDCVVVIGKKTMKPQLLIVTQDKNKNDMTGEFTAVAYDERVLPYWTNPPAEIPSEIYGSRSAAPAPVTVVGVSTTGYADNAGIVTPAIRIGLMTDSYSESLR